MMAKKNKRKNYIAKSMIQAIDHILDRLIDEDMKIVIELKLKKEEGNE